MFCVFCDGDEHLLKAFPKRSMAFTVCLLMMFQMILLFRCFLPVVHLPEYHIVPADHDTLVRLKIRLNI